MDSNKPKIEIIAKINLMEKLSKIFKNKIFPFGEKIIFIYDTSSQLLDPQIFYYPLDDSETSSEVPYEFIYNTQVKLDNFKLRT